MVTITVATSKGGAGKTTVAQLVLGALAREGYHVAAIDADFNHTLSDWVRTFTKRDIDTRAETDEGKIVGLVGELEAANDLVMIDTAGAAAQATVFAIGVADLVLVPLQLSSQDVVEAIKTMKLVESASSLTRRTIPSRLLLTDYQPHTNIARHIESEIARYELPSLATKLHRLVAFKEMTFTGDVPADGSAGRQVDALLEELHSLGALPFLREKVSS